LITLIVLTVYTTVWTTR